MEKELVQSTVLDLEICRDSILDRHRDTPTLCLRFDSVFKQLINSLSNFNDGKLSTASNDFEPKPIKNFMGIEIQQKVSTKIKLETFEPNEVEMFKEKIESIYSTFSIRETVDLIDSLEPIEIRGVAKLAGVKDFEKQPIAGPFIFEIKKAISDKAELQSKKEAERLKLKKA